ncbi:PucR family transcriptional regulator [Clostridium aciditolerans]|uniref:PucR family transcriptional regulator n=1 Tax=Clostridium aciditolerans TaxID=339861 RepID=A0A934M1I7_9CLOT|nr:PucR family transcriptional regulator [Clostridium aciditolerans]MBI6871137.1 PucR family transcriptional regulator [Clostridium aciditolerans]
MNIKAVLKTQSLNGSKVIAGKDGLLNEIYGVNVLEALDIENWGKFGEVILTSYFALHNLSDSELDSFFEKIHTIGISAIIIKLDRLVHQIPSKIIELCNKHSIPLIQINKEVKYESIILDILEPIIDKNVYLLNKYYEVHSELTSLALKIPSIEEMLYEFKKMILRDVSFINSAKGTEISTNPKLSDVTILGKSEVLNEKYMQFNYERYDVIYNTSNQKKAGTQIRVHISYLEFNDYELIIHEESDPIDSEDFMVIENAVKFLQMELLKKYVISQSLFQQKNNIISDLLNDRLYDRKDIDDVLESLEISSCKFYQLILIKLYQVDENKNLDKNLMLPILSRIRNKFKLMFKDMAFLEKSDRIVFIFNFNDDKDSINIDNIEKIMQALVENNLFKDYYYRISISSKVERADIPKANKEVLDTQKILRSFHNSNKILSYEELGIYKLFLESNSLNELQKFIPPKISKFVLEYPQLFETLKIFLDSNQSYITASEKLFLHPKTVRYRIDKTKAILNIELTDPEEILQIQVASRLFKLIEQEEHK